MRSIHYYVQGLLDLEDVLQTIIGIIDENVPPFARTNIKKQCSVSSMPLKDRLSGMILKINMPEQIFLKKTNASNDKVNENKKTIPPKPAAVKTTLPVTAKKIKQDK
jgi:hypothetical protein